MYDFTVHDCTQKQNGSPYYSFIIRQCKRVSRSRKIVEIQKFASIVTWRHTSLALTISYLLKGTWTCAKSYQLHLVRCVFSENILCHFRAINHQIVEKKEFNWICFFNESVKALIFKSKFDALILMYPWTTQPWF